MRGSGIYGGVKRLRRSLLVSFASSLVNVVFIFFLSVLSCVNGSVKEVELVGVYEKLGRWSIDVVYQAPLDDQQIRGVVFLAHGCSHSATDFWPASATCPGCIGLPVERAIVKESLSRGYITIAQSSRNRKRKCWDHHDMPLAEYTIDWALRRWNLPGNAFIHLMGASSGGSFVGKFALRSLQEGNLPFKLTSTVIQIMPVIIARATFPLNQKIPGILFVHMKRDERSAAQISATVARAASSSIKEIIVNPLKIYPQFFYEHGKHLSKNDSSVLVSALTTAGYIEKESRLLLSDPRGSAWRTVVKTTLPHIVPLIDDLEADRSGISELM